jgi:hypothetical protein
LGEKSSVAKIFLRCASHYKYAMNTIIPTTIVDNFFEDPDSIRAFAQAQQYKLDEQGRWPGSRSYTLEQLNPQLFAHTCNRMLSVFWDMGNVPLHWTAQGAFQSISASYGAGWVHQDADSLLTAIVYLTPMTATSAGTSIYRRKDRAAYVDPAWEEAKRTGYLTGAMNTPEYLAAQAATNGLYEPTVQVANLYNRLLIFDSSLYHGVPTFDTHQEDRLTLTMFFKSIASPVLNPMQRMNRCVDY